MDGAYACSVNGKGYIFGGFNGTYAVANVYEYDPVADTWTQKANYPGGQAIFPCGFVLNNKIYVGLASVSGMAGTKLFYEYNPATDSWTQKANFPGGPRQACYSFAYGNVGYVGGGEENYSTIYNDTYQYSPIMNSWKAVSSLVFPSGEATAWCSSFVLGNTAYVGLGADFNGGTLNYSKKFFKTTLTVGTQEIDSDINILIYPNPVNETLKIKSSENYNSSEIIIYNSVGQEILNSIMTNEIDVSSLPNGIYYLRITNESNSITKSFIIE